MNLAQVRESFAAPVAGLLLVLLVWFLAAGRPKPSVGLRIPVVKFKQHSIGYVCEDDLPIVLRLTADGQMWINQTKVVPDRLSERVSKIVHSRDEFAVYVLADPSVPYGQFAEFLERLYSSTPDLHVILVTEKLRERLQGPTVVRVPSKPQEYVPPCDQEWQENGFRAPSMYAGDVVFGR